ncbi:hypothetical protein BS50DRAFT_373233 [Corynespora cassiicola Philippines]|uniref:Beta-lactamase-related domain-containing protein n=1 Tax=Corynespora cassiicola Philippines TaxID=1448308 RepID=A0A2T2NMV5_CORCC|nr:hypothetical protein BS50DRAFT_373233 [Corynespora cassiicola Philippines]
MGAESPSRTVYSHNGNFNGATTAIYMVPESTSAVVLLSNARGLSDATDWIAQDILQTMFEFQPTVDFVSEAKKCRKSFNQWFEENIQGPLQRHRLASPHDRRRPDYYGVYRLSGYDRFTVKVTKHTEDSSKLILEVNGKALQRHILSHYHYDVWEFAPSFVRRLCKKRIRGLQLVSKFSDIVQATR